MTKEYLEALNIIKFNPDDVDGLQYLEAFKVVEKALHRLESIDNANPSEALKELEQDIKDRVILAEDRQLKLCVVIKQALIKAQEQEKENIEYKNVLKILFKKRVDLNLLYWSIDVESYNSHFILTQFWLTKKEFELIKRYFL